MAKNYWKMICIRKIQDKLEYLPIKPKFLFIGFIVLLQALLIAFVFRQ